MENTFGARRKKAVKDRWNDARVAEFLAALTGAETTEFNAAAAVDDLSDEIKAKAVTRLILEQAFDERE